MHVLRGARRTSFIYGMLLARSGALLTESRTLVALVAADEMRATYDRSSRWCLSLPPFSLGICFDWDQFQVPTRVLSVNDNLRGRRSRRAYIRSASLFPDRPFAPTHNAQPTLPPSSSSAWAPPPRRPERDGFRRRSSQHRRHHRQCHLLRPLPLPGRSETIVFHTKFL